MQIDGKSFILGAIVGYCVVVFNASVQVARDKVAKENIENKDKA